MIRDEIVAGLRSFKQLETPVGKLASGVECWPLHLRIIKAPEIINDQHELMFGNIKAGHPAFLLRFVEFGGASEHAQAITRSGGEIQTVVSLQMSWPISTGFAIRRLCPASR